MIAAHPSRILAGLLVLGMALTGCGTTPAGATLASTQASPSTAAAGSAVTAARAAIAAALGGRHVILQDPQVPYRPAEPASLSAVSRAVYQAVLPRDADHGYIVVYDFGTDATARQGGQALADYVGSPVGRVNFPLGTRFHVRQLGSTVLFYADLPDSPDRQAGDVADAIATIGTEVSVPR